LGSVGCAVYWRIVIEEINKTPNPPRHLTELIASSLAKLGGPQQITPGPKFYTLCETLKLYLNASRITVFSEFCTPISH
jgi:hypothetical protein